MPLKRVTALWAALLLASPASGLTAVSDAAEGRAVDRQLRDLDEQIRSLDLAALDEEISDADAELAEAKKEVGAGQRKHHHHQHKGRRAVSEEPQPAGAPADVEAAARAADADLQPADAPPAASAPQVRSAASIEAAPVAQVQTLQVEEKGHLLLNGPLPPRFGPVFVDAVVKATGSNPQDIHYLASRSVAQFLQIKVASEVVEVTFEAPTKVVGAVESQASDPDSPLAKGALHNFLVADDDDPQNAVQEKGIDTDTQMPYGELEPFGREDTAQELTESSVRESNNMVDSLERAEVAEEKRSVFRALTRLRGAAITSFDGIARSQTGNIDEYNKTHKWRKAHPMHHLADEESDISKWAFPDNADLLELNKLEKRMAKW